MRRGTLSASPGRAPYRTGSQELMSTRRCWRWWWPTSRSMASTTLPQGGTSPAELCALADWLVEREVEEVVMESTAQYWRPVWEALQQHWRPQRRERAGASRLSGTLHLAQAQSNRGPGGRKKDFPDPERLVKRPRLLGYGVTSPKFAPRRVRERRRAARAEGRGDFVGTEACASSQCHCGSVSIRADQCPRVREGRRTCRAQAAPNLRVR